MNNLATSTGRVSSAVLHESNVPRSAELKQEAFLPCCTFLNMTGDITIAWDEQNKEKVLELIRMKMSQGYNFFTTKRVPLVGIQRKVRVSNKNIDGLESLIIPDKEFEKLIAGMNDKEVATLFNKGDVELAKRQDNPRERHAMKRLDKAEDVLKEQSVALRPIQGG